MAWDWELGSGSLETIGVDEPPKHPLSPGYRCDVIAHDIEEKLGTVFCGKPHSKRLDASATAKGSIAAGCKGWRHHQLLPTSVV